MAAEKKIGVVIPVYNAKRYLRQCIQSVLNQTFQDFRLVLVDDGSSDGSGKICDTYAAKDSRVCVIHQPNQGAVLARAAGVLSEYAQTAKYICLCDADDMLEPDALRVLYEEAGKNDLDCVCADMAKMWKGVKLHSKFHAPCFEQPKVYSGEDIINDLYISCFGISNYPVSLCAKLYRTELITRVMGYPPVVWFMGDDLSITLRLLPETRRLGILPEAVYNYRIGGNTSRYMPYMLDDFLRLYRFKTEMRQNHPMPQDAEYFMAVELLNVLMTWFEMYKRQGKHTEMELIKEIGRVAALPEVQDALSVLQDRNKKHRISGCLEHGEYGKIAEMVMQKLKKEAPRRLLRQILYSL